MPADNTNKPLANLNILLVSAFFESEMTSLREFQYSRALAEAGANVNLYTSNQSNVWKHNRAKILPTNPLRNDPEFVNRFQVKLQRIEPILRISDFFILPIPFRLIKESDIIHIIEFRQGFTVIIAIIAKLLNKTVIYDHEQRGDRFYTPLHYIDSLFRRVLIAIGSLFVDHVRHTVIQNRDFYLNNALTSRPMYLSPLGADEEQFFYSDTIRQKTRNELGISENRKLVVFAGKITSAKRPLDVIKASIESDWTILLIGRIDVHIQSEISSLAQDNIIALPWVPSSQLNSYYNAADCVVFTAFSVSYWEAALTGLKVLVPASRFAQHYLGNDHSFILFGNSNMFLIEDEEINPNYPLYDEIRTILLDPTLTSNVRRETTTTHSWSAKRQSLVDFYNSIKTLRI